jgi:hypothetical protein
MNIDLQKLRATADRAKADQETAIRLKAFLVLLYPKG